MRHRRLPSLFACGLLLLPALPLQAHEDGLPLGDHKLSTQPQAGYLMSCRQDFDPRAGGARADVPWIRGERWYPDEKAVVDGSVNWPNARFTLGREGRDRVLRSNDLPAHPTGVFPVQPGDDAWQWDPNPNRISADDILLRLPAEPEAAAQPECVGGEVGILRSGALLFSAIDAGGRDAVAHETQDHCNGHPQASGLYHYHGPSDCVPDPAGDDGRHSDLAGYAFDGFGIYGIYGEDGRELRSADLDACHGHTHEVMWDGQRRVMYHYHLTRDFPYSVGCFHGRSRVHGPLGSKPMRQDDGPRPRRDQNGLQRFAPPPRPLPPPTEPYVPPPPSPYGVN